MIATIAGCKVGFSEDIQRHIPEPCAKCKGPHSKWFPWPGLWLCDQCFIMTGSTDLFLLKKERANENNNSINQA